MPDHPTSPQKARLLDCGLCYEENGEEVHPHPECTVAPAAPVITHQPADRAAIYAEVADRLAADAERGNKEGLTRIYRRSAAIQVRKWAAEISPEQDVAPAATCSARRDTRGEVEEALRLCIRAAHHHGRDHVDEHGYHWSETAAVYPQADGTLRTSPDTTELRRWAAEAAAGGRRLPSIHAADVEGWCPACGNPTLMVEAGRLTCTLMGCPRPEAAAHLLQGVAAALAEPALTSTPDGWDLADVEAREAAATRGPWRVERDEQKLTRLVVSDDGMLHADLGYLGNANQADAEFTAHAREDVPRLIALVRAFHLDWAQALFKIHTDADLRETEGQTELAAYARELATLITSSELPAEETDTRLTDLYERWVKGGLPPLGTTLARWWDARLVELQNAIQPANAQRQPAVVSQPDGSPPA
ncbi:hypothetical protein [Streptomyces sp. NPDC102487]|uniref:hypothetical protein n=1 Tax=Streptomyces sp. NPDC102487 TaxID=3366182 RepID=UPI003820F7E0